ncbi:putative ribonuclease H-like domain-containing protein [Tanacetum coccineum]|uniref:Ribonuclease H-like domain-containing protein n=1 Tax=Tanacetum coccineum TaxID=301880 RepID=A0ABQ5D5A6_9ASTR
MCTEFEKMMHKKFQISSMGELTFFLGLQVTQKDDGIFISQDKYVDEILKKFGFSTMRITSTPMETSKPLLKDAKAEDVDDSTFDLEAYSDSDYAGVSLDRKSTTGGCQFLGSRLISWQCKKQTIVAISTTEVECVAAANCCGQVTVGDTTAEGVFRKLVGYFTYSGPTTLVADKTIHEERVDSVERAATTATSLDAEQGSGSGPKRQDTILGDKLAQTWFERLSKQSNEPPLSRVNTLQSGENNMKLQN